MMMMMMMNTPGGHLGFWQALVFERSYSTDTKAGHMKRNIRTAATLQVYALINFFAGA
jgi:hypothetical protein